MSTFDDTEKFEPVVDPDKGGTSLGNSYLNEWVKCPRSWYNKYYRKIETQTHTGQGIDALYTGIQLLTGTLFHEGLDAYYKSGWKDGQDTGKYSLFNADSAIKQQWQSQKNRYESEAVATQDYDRVSNMMVDYHKTYGPGGSTQDWPDMRILGSEDGPLVEQDFRFELKPGYWYTGRLDAIALVRGEVVVLEHKTTSAYGIRPRTASLPHDSQFTGEIWLAQQALPDVKVDSCCVNIVLKDRSPNSKYSVAVRETTRRNPQQIDDWKQGACSIIDQINDAVGAFEESLKAGTPKFRAEAQWFPKHGERNGNCTAYNSVCMFSDLCAIPHMEDKVLKTFRTKNIEKRINE